MVRTRIAPSPTGEDLHIGNLYTALINWAYAKKNKGKFIVRIEDTDRERLVQGSEQKILQTLKDYGLDYDEGVTLGGNYGPYQQSARLDIYQKYAQELIKKGQAYYCFCSKERLEKLRQEQQEKKQITRYDRFCLEHIKDPEEKIKQREKYVIRLKTPMDTKIVFNDLIRGEIVFDSNLIDDQILIKSDGFPTYHLAVVIDDHLMKITHIIRAEEWISSTPKHVILYNAFAWNLPIFAHLPILRNPDRSKLSKRKNPVWSSWYLQEGFLPEAVLNYLSLMGWSHPAGKDIFTMEEFIELFDLQDIISTGPIFDIGKLTWVNGEYIRKLTVSSLKSRITQYLARYDPQLKIEDVLLHKLIVLAQTRMNTLKDFKILAEHFFTEPKIDIVSDQDKIILADLTTKFGELTNWQRDEILLVLKDLMIKHFVKMSVFYKLLTGQERGLPLPESLEILGKEKALQRLTNCL